MLGPKKEVIVDKASENSFSLRSTAIKNTIPEQPKAFARLGLPPKEVLY